MWSATDPSFLRRLRDSSAAEGILRKARPRRFRLRRVGVGDGSPTSFVLTFRNAADRTITEAEGQAWMEWFGQIGSSILDAGRRVGATSALGAAPSGSVITGYTVIKATDLEAAVLLA